SYTTLCRSVCVTLQGQNLGDGGSQSGLAVVNVADGADVNMRLRTVKFCLFSHWNILPLKRFLVITASRLHKMRCKAILLDYPFKIKRFSRKFSFPQQNAGGKARSLLLGTACNDLVGDVLGHRLVVRGLHDILATALRHGALSLRAGAQEHRRPEAPWR